MIFETEECNILLDFFFQNVNGDEYVHSNYRVTMKVIFERLCITIDQITLTNL